MQKANVASQRLNNAIRQLRRTNETQSTTNADQNETQRPFETSFISVDNARETNNSSNQLFLRDIWVADTGASCHITNSDFRAISLEERTMLTHSIGASGNMMETRKLVDINGIINNAKNGERITFTMGKCRFGGSRFNLCLLTKMTNKGWKIEWRHVRHLSRER